MIIAASVELRGALRVLEFDEAEGVTIEALRGIQAQLGVPRVLNQHAFDQLLLADYLGSQVLTDGIQGAGRHGSACLRLCRHAGTASCGTATPDVLGYNC